MITRRAMLRVKVKSLCEEAKIIRREERIAKRQKQNDLREELRLHRVGIVRLEQRASILAYGFLRGLKYRQIEAKSKTEPNWKRVRELVKKYGIADFAKIEEQMQRFDQWHN